MPNSLKAQANEPAEENVWWLIVEVVTRESKADGQDKPVDEPKITSIRVETYGVDYGEPETIEPFNYYNWLMKQYSTTQSSNN